ncbi:hypothetical protein SLE2022_351420 [Rubroshorea leprosula]
MHHEIVGGDNGPVSVIGPEHTRCDGLEMGCIGPNQEGVGDKVNGLIEEVAAESPLVKGQGATDCVIKKRRNIEECYPEDDVEIRKAKAQWITGRTKQRKERSARIQQITAREGLRAEGASLFDGCIAHRNRVIQWEMNLHEVRKMISMGKRLGIQLQDNEEEVQSRLMEGEELGDVGGRVCKGF